MNAYHVVTVAAGAAYILGQLAFACWPQSRPARRRTWADESREDPS